MKKPLIIVLSLMMCLSFFGCGKKEVDTDALAKSLVADIKYDDVLFELDSDMVKTLFELPDGVTGAAYAGSGATAEEVAVFIASDEKSAEALETSLKARLESRAESYASYMPDEVFKIENAVISREGKYVAMCVSNDSDGAAKIISNFFD